MALELKSGTKMSLGTIPLAELLMTTHLSRETVVFSLKSGEIVKNIFIKDGNPVFANSNAKSDGIKMLLLKEKKLSENQVAAIEDGVRKTGSKFIDVMVSLGYWAPDKVEDLKAKQAREILIDAFGMLKGTCEVIKNESVFSKIGQYRMSLHQIVLEGVKRHMSIAAVEQAIPDLAPENYFLALPKSEKDDELASIAPEEKGLLTIIGSTPKVADVLSSTFLKKDEVYKYLYCLKIFGFIDIETEASRTNRSLDKGLTPENRLLKESISSFYKEIGKRNYYELLDVLADASQTELDKSLEILKARYDPIKNAKLFWGTDKDIPNRIIERLAKAHSVLSDPRKRAEYQSFVDRGEAQRYDATSTLLLREEPVRLAGQAMAAKNYKAAFGYYSKAIEITPDDPELLARTAGALFKAHGGPSNMQEANRAMAMLKKAFEKDPQNYLVFLEFGSIFKALGKDKQALESLKKALLLNPNCSEAVLELESLDPKGAEMARVKGLYRSLDKANYYEILDVGRGVSSDGVKNAYHLATKRYHPDKYFTKDDQETKDMANAIYKRVVEAYMVLKNPQKRKEYDEQLGQFKEEKEIRLKDASDVVQKKEKSEVVFKSAQARKFFELGLTSFSQKRLNAAKINFQLALGAEPDNVHVQRKLKEVIELEKSTEV